MAKRFGAFRFFFEHCTNEIKQFDKQVRQRYSKLFTTPFPINGKPSIYQRRGFIEKSFEQTEIILKQITNTDYEKISYIQSLNVASVFKIMNEFLKEKKEKKW